MKTRKKIAVLGGGIGSLSAAFELTDRPGWDDEYEITVYQQGWRLGGKCASGHDMRPEFASRIYEHGLHLFAGFYHHAFKLLTRAYGVIERPEDHPNRTVWDAFTGLDEVTLIDQYPQPDGSIKCVPWYINLEPNNLVPGEASSSPTVADLIQIMVGQLIKYEPPNGAFSGPKSPIIRHDNDQPEKHLPNAGEGIVILPQRNQGDADREQNVVEEVEQVGANNVPVRSAAAKAGGVGFAALLARADFLLGQALD